MTLRLSERFVGPPRLSALNGNGYEHSPDVLFFREETSSTRHLTSPPPPVEWIIPGFLPRGVEGMLAGAGGSGKGHFALALCVSIATGEDFLGVGVTTPAEVLYIAAEDPEDELHRRVHTIASRYGLCDTVGRELLGENLHTVSLRGGSLRLTQSLPDGGVDRTEFFRRLHDTIRAEYPTTSLIWIDPISRFKGGNANDENDATEFIAALEALTVLPHGRSATVIGSHHVNKQSVSDPDNRSQAAARGSSGLVDGARWVCVMSRLSEKEAKTYSADPDRHVSLVVAKSNYTPTGMRFDFERLQGGVLAPVELTARSDESDERDYQDVLEQLRRLLERDGPTYITDIRYRLSDEIEGFGQLKVWTVAKRALSRGDLIETSDRKVWVP